MKGVVAMKLIDKRTGAEVKKGDCITFEGRVVEVMDVYPPKHAASSGHVQTEAGFYYAHVYGLEFVDRTDRDPNGVLEKAARDHAKAEPEEAEVVAVAQAPSFCYDPRHDTPCPQPCVACKEECDPKHIHPAPTLADAMRTADAQGFGAACAAQLSGPNHPSHLFLVGLGALRRKVAHLLVIQMGGNYTDLWVLAGPAKRTHRRWLMEELLGRRPTAKEIGISILRDSLFRLFDISGDCMAARERRLADAVTEYARKQDAVLAHEALKREQEGNRGQ
jgi:hypothetical protein